MTDIIIAQYIKNDESKYEKGDLPKATVLSILNDITVIDLSDEITVISDNDIIVSHQSKYIFCPKNCNCKTITVCLVTYGCCFCVCSILWSEIIQQSKLKIL
jgi:hypothetical protein